MPDQIPALARLAAEAGINATANQIVVISATLGQQDLARAIAGACYDLGARYVEVNYSDPYVRKVRLTRAPEAALGTIPAWTRRKLLDLEEAGGANIALTGPAAPHLLDDVDPGRIGRDQVAIPEALEVVGRQRVRWTVIPGPSEGWAQLVFGDHEPDALDRLWEAIGTICRLDADDPIEAWRERADELGQMAQRLDDAQLDSLHFTGPGTDLTVGLLNGARWEGGGIPASTGSATCPTSPPRRCSPRQTRSAPTVLSPPPSRCSSPDGRSAGCGWGSRAAARCRSTPTTAPS